MKLFNNKNKEQKTEVFEQELTKKATEAKEAVEIKEAEAEELRQAIDQEIEGEKTRKKQPALIVKSKVQPKVIKSEKLIIIEEILQQDLEQIYFSLPQNLKKEFKEKGEQTAIKIEVILRKTKIKVKEIFKLIIDWLKIIPGVNKYFLEQEAKIKTDKILKLRK